MLARWRTAIKEARLIQARWATAARCLLLVGQHADELKETTSQFNEALTTAKLWDNQLFERRCEQAQIAWLKVSFLREHRRIFLREQGPGQRLALPALPRRQDLPGNALVIGSPSPVVNRWVVSHPWLAAQHPDIDGEHLAQLIDELDDHGAQDQDVVFMDYHSMFQGGAGHDDRSAEQLRLFKVSLKAINMLYTSSKCKVVVLAEIPESASQESGYVSRRFLEDEAGEWQRVWVKRNATPYHERGWCFFELLISLMFKTCVSLNDGCRRAATDLLADLFSIGTWSHDAASHSLACLPWLWPDSQSILWPDSQSIPPASTFQDRLTRGDISFIKVKYLRKLAAQNLPWPEWEDIDEIWKWSGDPSQLAHSNGDWVKAYTISYPWNPDRDPEDVLIGYNRDIIDRLSLRNALNDDLVFVRRMSIPCRPETDAQKERCQRAEEVFYWLFCSPRFRVFTIWNVPKSLVEYHKRGRCIFELLVATFSGTLVLDEEAVRVLVIKNILLSSLGRKQFTRGKTDLNLVGALLARLVLERNGLGRLAHETNVTIAEYEVAVSALPDSDSKSDCDSDISYHYCGGCFPSSACVALKTCQEPVPVTQLRLGDEVLVRGGRYEPVMLFVHRDERVESRVRVLAMADGSALRLTPDHVVPLAAGQQRAARDLRRGDVLLSAIGKRVAVESASYGPAIGELHFKTPSGEVCVDGILCCTYNEQSAILRCKQQQQPSWWRKSWAPLELRGRRFLYRLLAFAWGVSKPVGLVTSRLVQAVMSWRYPTDIIF